jgi:hypothetical protein
MAMHGLFPGCVSPVSTVLLVETDDEDFDLSEVTAARIRVRFPNNTETTWDAVLSDEDVGEITLTRAHVTEDIPAGSEGTAYMWAELDIPDATAPMITAAAAVPILKVGG